jgi:hypothetical protein
LARLPPERASARSESKAMEAVSESRQTISFGRASNSSRVRWGVIERSGSSAPSRSGRSIPFTRHPIPKRSRLRLRTPWPGEFQLSMVTDCAGQSGSSRQRGSVDKGGVEAQAFSCTFRRPADREGVAEANDDQAEKPPDSRQITVDVAHDPVGLGKKLQTFETLHICSAPKSTVLLMFSPTKSFRNLGGNRTPTAETDVASRDVVGAAGTWVEVDRSAEFTSYDCDLCSACRSLFQSPRIVCPEHGSRGRRPTGRYATSLI